MTDDVPPTIIAFASPKGGVGKSTSCLGIAGALAAAGHTVHVADFDQNQTLWAWYATNPSARAIPGLTVERAPQMPEDIGPYIEDLYKTRNGYVLLDLAGTLTDVMLLLAAFASLVVIPTKLGWADIMEANKLALKVKEVATRVGKPITHRLLLNEIPLTFLSKSQTYMLDEIEGLGLQRFETLIHERPAYGDPHLTGLPIHFDNQNNAPIKKAVDELNGLFAEVMTIVGESEQTEQKAAA
jgi:chromosome partitioning protein